MYRKQKYEREGYFMDFLEKIFSIKKRQHRKIIYILGIKISLKIAKSPEALIKMYIDEDNVDYNNVIKRIQQKGKCRVAFYVFEIAKWKTDSLYKLMQEDDRFEPFVVLGFTPGRTSFYSWEEKKSRIKEQIEFFESKNIKVVCGYDVNRNQQISLETFKPDVVFYQQHLGICQENLIEKVKKYALCCYVPYNVPNYVNVEYDYNIFCSHLFRFYTLNNELKEYYEIANPLSRNIYSTGHTALDSFYLNRDNKTDNKYVIYAPHFSIMHPSIKNKFFYSTFNYNGKLILDYAKSHPEINWVFKPHPHLKESLKKMSIPQASIDEYYNEWSKIGLVCETSEYYELFANSKAMITDCGSFLTEYFCTGKPLLHLIHPISINWPYKGMEPMFNSFYQIHSNEELVKTLDRVVINNDDYKKQERLDAGNKLNFVNQFAGKNIINDLCEACHL